MTCQTIYVYVLKFNRTVTVFPATSNFSTPRKFCKAQELYLFLLKIVEKTMTRHIKKSCTVLDIFITNNLNKYK